MRAPGLVKSVALFGLLLALRSPAFADHPVQIVAAENFYGDVAAQIGGKFVEVSSVISNPGQDPHLFEVVSSAARGVSRAAIVVYNGLDYDPWMARLVQSSPSDDRTVLEVAALIGAKQGDNPHIWYDPETMVGFAAALSQALDKLDPVHHADYAQNLAAFTQSMRALDDEVTSLRRKFAGTPVTATEPVFGAMFQALGLAVRGWGFQLAVMNNTEPSAADIIAFEGDLRNRRVKLLVYNSQVRDPLAERMEELAHASNIPVVAVTETLPAGTTYQLWLAGELAAVGDALRQSAP